MLATLSMTLMSGGWGRARTHNLRSPFESKEASAPSGSGKPGGGGNIWMISANVSGPTNAGGQLRAGEIAPAGVTAAAIGRHATIEATTSRRVFILAPF